MKRIKSYEKSYKFILSSIIYFHSQIIMATTVENVPPSFGSVAANVTSSFSAVTKFITAGAYLAGLAFFIGAVLKFKQHKDNPTQIPIGTPIALLFIAGGLLFLPSMLNVMGVSTFGSQGVNTGGGPEGTIFK